MVIYLGYRLPDTSCSQPERARPDGRDWRGGQPLRSYSALHRMGFTVPVSSPRTAVGSYPTVSPLPATVSGYKTQIRSAGGLLSVALSVGLPRLGVTQHPALWCSDFPHLERGATIRPACNNLISDFHVLETTSIRALLLAKL
jgi:hypothetical protein